jgi:hypothetical protein
MGCSAVWRRRGLSSHVRCFYSVQQQGETLLELVPIETAQNIVLVIGQNTSAGLHVSCYCSLNYYAWFVTVIVVFVGSLLF